MAHNRALKLLLLATPLPALAGCWESHALLADATMDAPVDARPDVSPDAIDVRSDVPDVADVADVADVPVEPCPETLTEDGPVHLEVLWRHRAPGVWTASGSAGIAVLEGVVLAIVPTMSTSPPPGLPSDVWLDAETGATLEGRPDELLSGVTAIAAGSRAVGMRFIAADSGGPSRPPGFTGLGVDPAGGPTDSWGRVPPDGMTAITPEALRAREEYPSWWAVVGGTLASGERGLIAVAMVNASVSYFMAHDLWRSTAGRGEGFVLSGFTDEVVWTTPEKIVLWTAPSTEAHEFPLPAFSEFVPVTQPPEVSSSLHYIFAGRSDDSAVGVHMWVESRTPRTLDLISSSTFDDLEPLVDRPEPRDLASTTSHTTLAWAAHRELGHGRVPSCLYVAPLGMYGEPMGSSVRVDSGVGEAGEVGIEHVRLAVDGDAFYLLWRHAPDLWVARIAATP
jgi:hypothetical protein